MTRAAPPIRPGTAGDAVAVARLHAASITEGFLPTLGERFLGLLYRRLACSSFGVLLVAEEPEAAREPVAFVAATTDTRALYRTFVLRDGVLAAAVAAPRLVRSWRRAWETLRYPATAGSLPSAEILAVAVAPAHRGRGIGRRLVSAATAELAARGVAGARVVAGRHNRAALAMYRACGFVPAASVEIHPGVVSEVLTWP